MEQEDWICQQEANRDRDHRIKYDLWWKGGNLGVTVNQHIINAYRKYGPDLNMDQLQEALDWLFDEAMSN